MCSEESSLWFLCQLLATRLWPSVVRGLGHWRPRVGWTSDIKAVANWRAPDTETTGRSTQYTYDKAYQPLTSHKAAGCRSSNGRQGAGKRVRPPGQSTRRGLSSPSLRLIISTTWSID